MIVAAIWFRLILGVALGLLSHPKVYAAVTRTQPRSADHEGLMSNAIRVARCGEPLGDVAAV